MRPILYLIFPLWVTAATAQITHRDLLQAFSATLQTTLVDRASWHPFPQGPEAWSQKLPDSAREAIIKAGENALHFEFKSIPATLTMEYSRNGNRTHYEKASFDKRNALWALTLAESVEGKGRFADKILDGVWSICEESYWGLPAHLGLQKAGTGLPDVADPTVDLFTAETAAVLAWTDYFAGPALEKISPLVRPRIYAEVKRRVFTPLQTAKYGYLGGGNKEAKLNNWAPWVMSNYCTAALLLESNPDARIDAVRRAMYYTDLYVDGLGEGGGCEEGPSYWTAAGACVFDVLNLLSDATHGAIDIYQKPMIRNMAAYIYKTHIAGKYYINIADAPAELVPGGIMIYRFGRAIDDTTMQGFGSWIMHTYPGTPGSYEQFHRTRILYDLLAEKEGNRYPPREPAIHQAWFADIQLMIARDRPGDRSAVSGDLFLASHAGTNGESHNHNDVGDFLLYAGGKPVIVDVGSGTYTARTFSSHRYDLWFNTSAYHNLPTVNGYQQKDGLAYAATNVQYRADVSTLSMDIAGAYPAEAGLQHWVRTVRLEKNTVTVTDRYTAAEPLKSLTQSFMTICPVDTSRNGVVVFDVGNGQHLDLIYDASTWAVTVGKIDPDIPEEAGVREHWEDKPIYRVLLTAKKMRAGATNTFQFKL
jgi:hypothetical protein